MTQDAHAGHGDCSEVLHRIYEYLDGEMSADDVRRVAAHLNECQPCLAEHDLDVERRQAPLAVHASPRDDLRTGPARAAPPPRRSVRCRDRAPAAWLARRQ